MVVSEEPEYHPNLAFDLGPYSWLVAGRAPVKLTRCFLLQIRDDLSHLKELITVKLRVSRNELTCSGVPKANGNDLASRFPEARCF